MKDAYLDNIFNYLYFLHLVVIIKLKKKLYIEPIIFEQ